jgi:type IV pilus assembly protein PilC
MDFQCRLGASTGEILEGVYSAENEAQLRKKFKESNLYILSLRRKGVFGSFKLSELKLSRLRFRDFLVFNQELATLLSAGMPLVQSLDIVRTRVESPVLKSVLDSTYERVRSGTSLSEAFAAHGSLIPGVYIASLMAGERSGSLEEVIRRYVAYSRLIDSVRRKTISALIYPSILLGLSCVVIGIIILRVVPEFSGFYQGMGAELPLATRVILAISDLLRQNLFLLGSFLLATTISAIVWLNTKGRRRLVDRFVLDIPWVGSIVRKFSTAQLARTLSTLLRGGIPLVSALDVAAASMGNRYLSQQLASVTREVLEGKALSTSLAELGVFQAVAIKMVEVGESTGSLQEMLTSVAEFFEEEIETSLSRFVMVVEPVLLVIMGLVIAILLLSLYMPLVQLGGVIS